MIIYLKSHRRMPIRTTPRLPWQDPQGAVPVGWCACGGEIYESDRQFCLECEKENAYESVVPDQSL